MSLECVVNPPFETAKEKDEGKHKKGKGEDRTVEISENDILAHSRDLLGLDSRVGLEELHSQPKEHNSPAQAQTQVLLAKIRLGRFRALHS